MLAQSQKDNQPFVHIYNESIESIPLFKDKKDQSTFITFISEYVSPPKKEADLKSTFSINNKTFSGIPRQPKNYHTSIELVMYSLQKNHFHLVIKEINAGSAEKFMRSLGTRYVMYYNKRHKRSGPLLQKPYKSTAFETQKELLLLSKHIHSEKLNGNSLTSYDTYLQETTEGFMSKKYILSNFSKNKDYQQFVEKHALSPQEVEIVKNIAIEDIYLTNISKSNFEKTPNYTAPSPSKSFVKPIVSAAFVFLVLFMAGLANVRKTQAQEARNIIAQAEDVVAKSSQSNLPTTTPAPEVASSSSIYIPEKEMNQKLIVTITDGSKSVNLREKPSTSSQKIGEAEEGKIFDFVVIKQGWYEIKLDEGTTAYLSSKYAKPISENNSAPETLEGELIQ